MCAYVTYMHVKKNLWFFFSITHVHDGGIIKTMVFIRMYGCVFYKYTPGHDLNPQI